MDTKPAARGWHVGDAMIGVDRAVVMGVVNVTPDSFSDGGAAFGDHEHPELAIGRAWELVEAGADIIDVGGESTRPGARPVPAGEEVERTEAVVAALADGGIPVSIDTTKSTVARAALDAGALVVNDVSAGTSDPGMFDLVADRDVACVLMHMQGTPATMQANPTYDDVVDDVAAFLCGRRDLLVAGGLAVERVALDPGIGFGKTLAHNLSLLAATPRFATLGPVLVGVSRKSFIGAITGVDDPAARDPASIAVAAWTIANGAGIVRVHDVAGTRQAVDVAMAIRTAG